MWERARESARTRVSVEGRQEEGEGGVVGGGLREREGGREGKREGHKTRSEYE